MRERVGDQPHAPRPIKQPHAPAESVRNKIARQEFLPVFLPLRYEYNFSFD